MFQADFGSTYNFFPNDRHFCRQSATVEAIELLKSSIENDEL